MRLTLLLALLPCWCSASPEETLTLLRSEISSLIDKNISLIPQFVRLTFHDCIGGCDGCVDMEHEDNAGLDIPIEALVPVCSLADSGITRADCWALAGLVAAEVAQDKTYFPFPIEYVGRQVCDGDDMYGGPDRSMPLSNGGTDHLQEFFEDEFGLSNQEIVALMGAHTLGGAHPENTGFNGLWTPNPFSLNNDYYDALENIWSQKEEPEDENGSFQWELTVAPDVEFETRTDSSGCPFLNLPGRGLPVPPDTDFELCPPLFMINIDVALSKDFGKKVDNQTGLADCLWANQPNKVDPRKPCKDSRLIDWVHLYKDDNDLFVNDFQNVFTKITNHNDKPLQKVEDLYHYLNYDIML